jgi:hypothetical protein
MADVMTANTDSARSEKSEPKAYTKWQAECPRTEAPTKLKHSKCVQSNSRRTTIWKRCGCYLVQLQEHPGDNVADSSAENLPVGGGPQTQPAHSCICIVTNNAAVVVSTK